jgi:putative endopeptidase
MIIGHEMYHGITASASTGQDSGYNIRRDRIIAQYDSLPPIDGVSVNGNISVTENLPDLGGLLASYDAWQAAGYAKKRTVVEGFTPEQRFFLHYARVWRAKQSGGHLRMLRGDVHAPNTARINGVVANIPAFAKAFGCREGDPMAKSATDRVDIW